MHYGIDIGGTKIEIATFDEDLNLLDSSRVPTPTSNYDQLINTITSVVSQADRKSNSFGTLGIGMPGLIDTEGRSKTANVACANGMPIVEDLKVALNRPFAINNDCRLFALSEANGGAADSAKTMYGAIIGTGAGGGFCIDKELYRSPNNLAGEYGHQPGRGVRRPPGGLDQI